MEEARKDPLSDHRPSAARTGYELLRGGHLVRQRTKEISAPLLIVHGGADRLADPRGSEELYARVGSKDRSILVYDGLYHEVLNEPENDGVVEDIVAWLEERTPRVGASRGADAF